jgi:hypothetical protein
MNVHGVDIWFETEKKTDGQSDNSIYFIKEMIIYIK